MQTECRDLRTDEIFQRCLLTHQCSELLWEHKCWKLEILHNNEFWIQKMKLFAAKLGTGTLYVQI